MMFARLCGMAAVGSASVVAFGVGGANGAPPTAPTAAAPVPARPPSGSAIREEFLTIARRLRDGENQYFGVADLPVLRAKIARDDLPEPQRLEARVRLWMLLLRTGDTDGAVEQIEAVVAKMVKRYGSEDAMPARWHLLRALTYLRQAELENCIRRHNRDCCVFPLAGGGVHTVNRPAREARRSYLAYLKTNPDDLAIRWLLNLVSMAVGDYPRAVPERFLIPPSAFASDFDIGRFNDVAGALGIDTFNNCGGVVTADFDGNGLLDIVTSTFDAFGPVHYYRNLGAKGFVDASDASGLSEQLGGLNCVGGDPDNDGHTDVLILRGAWLFAEGRIRNSLVRNNGDGTFTDVTKAAGLADPAYPTQTAAWLDYDNDGNLDLYVGNESLADAGQPDANYPSQLFRNNGDGTFTDVASAAGAANDRYAKGVTAGDYDNDGDMDLYVSNIGPNRLYRNNGDGTFTDVAVALGVTEPSWRSFATWFFDYDNDGWLDLFVVAYDATLSDIAADYLGKPFKASPPCLYHNTGAGRFTNVTKQMGLDHAYLPMGANFGDLDNDGYLDMYLTTGDPEYRNLMPNIMLRNDRGRRFVDVTTSGGFGHLQKGHGVSFADFDHDGDQDIYHQLGGFFEGDRFRNALFLNPGHGNHFLFIELVGTKTNRSGVGVRIKVVVETPDGRREIHRAVGSVSSFGGSPLREQIGLGDAKRILGLEVFWPVSHTIRRFADVPLDAMIEITEGRPTFRRIPLERFTLPVGG